MSYSDLENELNYSSKNIKTNKYEFTLKGMKCSNCLNKAEKALKELKFVRTANINLITEKAMITVNEKGKISEVKDHLSKYGLTVENLIDLNLQNTSNRIFNFQITRRVEVQDKEISDTHSSGSSTEDSKDDNESNNEKLLNKEDDYEFIKFLINDIDGLIETKKPLNQNKISLNKNESMLLSLEYDPKIITGRHLYESILKKAERYFVIEYKNIFTNSINELNKFEPSISKIDLIVCVLVTIILICLTMILNETSYVKILQDYYLFPKFSLYIALVLILVIFVVLYFGTSIYKRSIYNVFYNSSLNMETLITLGSLSAIALTIVNIILLFIEQNANKMHLEMMTMHLSHSAEAAATVVAIATIGKYFEEKAKHNIRNLTKNIYSRSCEKENNGFATNIIWIKPRNRNFTLFVDSKEYDIGMLENEDIFVPKEKTYLLCDSVVIHGELEVKENISFGVDDIIIKKKGDKIKSGSFINKLTSEKCVFMVESILEESILYKLIKETFTCLNQKIKFQQHIDYLVSIFVPIIIIISAVTGIVWSSIRLYAVYFNLEGYEFINFSFIISKTISILVVSCPCAFGLAIPTVTTIALNKALKHGILVKNLAILPEIRLANKIVFDKTGTLTELSSEVKIQFENNQIQDDINILECIMLLEKSSRHPIAEALYGFAARHFDSNQNNLSNVYNIRELNILNNGIQAVMIINGKTRNILIGNKKLIESQLKKYNCDSEDKEYTELLDKFNKSNLHVTYICIDANLRMILSCDTTTGIRYEAKHVINLLKSKKKDIFILSGDEQNSVTRTGQTLKIPLENCIGNADHSKKKEFLYNLKQNGILVSDNFESISSSDCLTSCFNQIKKSEVENKVMMIGDGINDILSLSEADFGISFNANSQLNLIASDIIFIKNDLNLVPKLLKLSKWTHILLWTNLFWAFAYNLCMIPITAGVFYHFWKFDMSPTTSSLFMLGSSLLIILTSNILRFVNLNYKNNYCKDLLFSESTEEDNSYLTNLTHSNNESYKLNETTEVNQ